jgi:hypothetical protein
MPSSNLKEVPNGKLPQLSYQEMRKFAAELTNDVCQNDATVDGLVMLAVHLMEHCHDWQYMDNLGMTLAQSLFGATNEWSDTVFAYAEKVRRKVVSDEETR